MEKPGRSSETDSLGYNLFLLFLFLAGSFAVYGGILGHEFISNWDDNVYVTANEAVRGFTFDHIKAAFTSFYMGNYAPLHIVSYMLDYTVWGGVPRGYLLTGILIHAVNAYLAYRLYLLLDKRYLIALAAALLFLVHPVQVESVAWLSERKTLLSMFFFLLALHAYLRYAGAVTTGRRIWFLLSLIAFLAALLSKAVAVILPLVLICLDWYAGGRDMAGKRLPDKIPFFICSAAVTAITLVSQRSAEALVKYVGDNPLNNAMTMMPVFTRYLRMLFWPIGLGPIYKPPIKMAMDLEVLLTMLLFLMLLSTASYLLYRRRVTGFCLALFFLGLLPVAHIFPLPTLMQDRYLYFPLLGFSLFFTALTADLAGRYLGEWGSRWVLVIILLISLPLAVAARKQTACWQNAVTLWSHATKVVPGSWQAWNMLAITQHDMNNLAGAEEAYLRLLAVAPKEKLGLNGIGILYGEKGDMDKSLHYLHQALQLYPMDPDTLINYGYAAFLKGNLAESRDAFMKAIAVAPGTSGKLRPTLLEIARRMGDKGEEQRLLQIH